MSFNNRVYLTEAEWETYMRRAPVRYVKKSHSEVCKICGLPPEEGNPLQHAHRIPFMRGIKQFKLTPDFLDGRHNILSAHRKVCNKKAELTDEQIAKYLKKFKSQ